jgi:hypothetical protein
MDYSAINHVIYTIGLKKEMFVIGGPFAAGLCEPRLAKSMGAGGEVIELSISSSNFEVLKGYTPKSPLARMEIEADKIVISERYMRITFHRGVPASWTNESGYQVTDPLPLKHWLNSHGYESWAKLMHDKPFEQRMAAWELSEEEVAFKEACSKHDWYSGYSDDFSVVRNGSAGLKVLEETRDRIGGNAKEIFEYYSNK